MNNTFCAINATILDKLINKNNIPLVYYFDGSSDDLIFDIMKSKSFIDFIYNDILSQPNGYIYGKISMFYYKDDKYTEQSFYLRDKISLSNICSELIRIVYADMMLNLFTDLYKKSFTTELVLEDEYKEQPYCDYCCYVIKTIYNKLKEKYGSRLSFITLKNYVLKHLSTFYFQDNEGKQHFKLRTDDINCIIDDLTNLLNNTDGTMD